MLGFHTTLYKTRKLDTAEQRNPTFRSIMGEQHVRIYTFAFSPSHARDAPWGLEVYIVLNPVNQSRLRGYIKKDKTKKKIQLQ